MADREIQNVLTRGVVLDDLDKKKPHLLIMNNEGSNWGVTETNFVRNKCKNQMKSGKFFLVTASSDNELWTSKSMQGLLNITGVHLEERSGTKWSFMTNSALVMQQMKDEGEQANPDEDWFRAMYGKVLEAEVHMLGEAEYVAEAIAEVWAVGLDQEAEDEQIVISLKRLRQNLGHCSRDDMVRILINGKATERAIKLAREEFRCDVCDSLKKPGTTRPATATRQRRPFQSIMMDLFQDLDYVLVYLDDILIQQKVDESEEEHIQKVEEPQDS